MKHFVLAFLITAAPLPALALSCLAPDVARSYAQFDAAEETYIVVHGRLTLDETDLPEGMTVDRNPPEMTQVPAHLTGFSLGGEGFTFPFERDLTLEVACIGPWCGGVRNGEDVLAFVRKGADGYAIEVSPCGGAIFGTPKPEMIKQAERCMRTGACKAD